MAHTRDLLKESTYYLSKPLSLIGRMFLGRRLPMLPLVALTALSLSVIAQNPVSTPPGVPVPPSHITPVQPLPAHPQPVPTQTGPPPGGSGPGIALNTGTWTFLGPGPQSITGAGGNQNFNVSGRIVAVAGHPTDANTIYIAAAGGGVWKTSNATTSGPNLTWIPLTDTQATLSMGAIAVAPSKPSVIYAGTGEPNNSADSNYGRGILVSTDGGNTWTLRQGPGNIFNRMATSAIAVHPTDSNTAYAAMMYGVANGSYGTPGIYKTTDGGLTWTNTTSGISVGAPYADVKLDLTAPGTIYTAIGAYYGAPANGVYKSTDGGGTWNKLTNAPNASTNSAVGRISLAVSKSNSLVLYVTTQSTSTYGLLSVVRSDDGGNSFHDVTPSDNYMGGQGWYDQTVVVDPGNSAIAYVAGAAGPGSILRTANSGVSWTDISTGGLPYYTSPHVDHHGIAFDANGILLDGNDGGIYRLDNPTGAGWSDLNGNLGTIQFEGIGLHPTDPNQAIAGSQDNGTALYSGSVVWQETDGGDGGNAKFSQTNGSRAYHIAPVGSFGPTDFFRRSDDGGVTWSSKTSGFFNADSFFFYAPFVVDPNNGNRLLAGADRVYESVNGADLWSPLSTPNSNGWTTADSIGAIGLAASDANTTYAATCCNHVFVTTNHGAAWTDNPLPASGFVSDIQVDRVTATTAYAVISGFSNSGNVFKTTNGGSTWTNISGNLPNEPVWSLQIDLDGTLYAGADDGVYTSKNGGGSWTRLGSGLPNAQVYQINLNPTLHILGAATHGRGAWEIATVLPSPNMTITKSHTGSFVQGQTGASYTITARNSGGVATSGVVTVTDTLPAGLTAIALSGTGWTCTLATRSCSRSDVLPAASNYPSITVTVSVSGSAPLSVSNIATVSGGGEIYTGDDQATDPTTILASGPDLTIAKSHTGNFIPGQSGAVYTITVRNIGASATTGSVAVTDTLPSGLTATAITGTGWSCTLVPLACSRLDALASQSNYPSITLTVNVSPGAPSQVTNSAVVAGGGETITSNNTATDPTNIVFNGSTSNLLYTFPDTAVAGGSAFQLSVSGSGFQPGVVVNWNATPLAITYFSSSWITATVPAALIASAGTASITVTNPTELPSNALSFTVVNSPVVPVLTSGFISYSWWTDTGLFADKFLYVSGSGFQQGMTLAWNGTNLGPLSSGLTVTVPLILLQVMEPGQVVITATNPGNSPSAPVILSIPELRSLTSISPAAVPAGNGSVALTLNGTGFDSGDTVYVWPGGYGLPTSLLSSTQLQTIVPAAFLAANGTLQVWVSTSTDSGAFASTNQLPLTVGTGGPVLSISKSHSGNFTPGQQNATYTLKVSNASGAGPTIGRTRNQVASVAPDGSLSLNSAPTSSPTSGPVTVNEFVPDSLSLVSMTGSGWGCASGTCTRSDILAGGASYPAITVTVNVSPGAPSSVVNSASVAGGGGLGEYVSDVTIIGQVPDLTLTKAHTGNFTHAQSGATYTITAGNSGPVPTSGPVTVTDNLPVGLTATSIAGTGWSCTQPSGPCTRHDALAAAASYPAITLTVNVAGNAPSGVTNTATISGGGEVNTANNTASDPTMILTNPPTISSLSPSSAPAGGAVFTLTINGTNFVSGATAKWGTTALTTTFASSSKLTAAVPANLITTAGTACVTVTTTGGTSACATFTINPALPLTIVNNPSFELGSATLITYTGSGNGGQSAASSWPVWNSVAGTTKTELCTAASCPSGSVPPAPVDLAHTLHVTTTGASSGVYQIFPSATLTSASVWLKVVSGSVLIQLLGPAGNVVRTASGKGVVWLPTSGAKFTEMILYSNGGEAEFYADAANLSSTVLPPPMANLSKLAPTSGPIGASVTITGTGFGAVQGTSSIAFHGKAATPSTWSDTSIQVSVPSGATSGDVVVTVNGQPSNGLAFTVTPRIVTNPSFELGLTTQTSFTGTGNGGASAATGWSVWNAVAGTTKTELCTATCPSGSVPPAPMAGTHTMHITMTSASSGVYQMLPQIALQYGSVWLKVVSGTAFVELLGPGGPIMKTSSSTGMVWLPANGAVLNEIVIYATGSTPAEFYVDAVTVSPSTSTVVNSSFELGATTQLSFTGSGNGGASAATGWVVWNNSVGTTKTELCTTSCPSGSVPPAPVAGTHTMHITTTGASSGVYQIFPSTALEYGCLWLKVVSGTALIEMLGPGGSIIKTSNSTGPIWLSANGAAINEIVIYSSGNTPADLYIDAVGIAP